MNTRIFWRILFLLVMFFSSTTLVYADFPSVELPSTDLGSGQSDLSLRVSSGVQASVFINDELLGRQDVIADPVRVNLTDSLPDVTVPVGSRVIFENKNATYTYALNITDGAYKELTQGDTLRFPSNVPTDFTYRDENSGREATITFTDTLQDITFTDVQQLLEDGSNDVRVELSHPLSSLAETSTTRYTVTYEQYSVDITIQNATNITNTREAQVEGFVSDADAPLFYVINKDEIVNPGIMNPVDLDGNSFNITINRLNEGENVIRFIATDPGNQNVFTGEQSINVTVDTRPPSLSIDSSFKEYTNEQQLVLNITTDATRLNYSFRGKNTSVAVEGGNVTLDLSLKQGENPLVLTAIDKAGNTAKERHNIKFDKKKPDIVDRSLEPKNIFQEGGDAHFFFQKMSGNTTKPNVDMTIFTLPAGAEDSEGNRLTCGNYENLFLRNLGQLDRERNDDEGPELNLEEKQVSLLGAIHKRIDTSSDGNGNFEAVIGLQERNFDRGDYEDAREQDRNPEVGDVSSRNRVCVFLHDRYGNTRMREYDVTLDAGNTQWRPGEVTTIPNTVYAAEIENQGDIRGGDGRGQIEFSMVARFNYIGPGQVTQIQDPIIDVDRNGARDTDHVRVDQSRMNYRLDKDSGELIVHVPVTIRPLDKSPAEYPDSLKMAFQLSGLSYEVDQEDIPIDNRNPVYFQTEVNVERPLDHTKWLTPEMINDTIGFLNQSIALTRTAKEYTGTAAVGGVLACTAAKFWYGVEVAEAQALPEGERQSKIQEAKERLFMICDRVACTASPPKCEGDIAGFGDSSEGAGIFETNGETSFGQDETLSEAQILRRSQNQGEPDKLAQFESLRVGQQCQYGRTDANGEEEVIPGVKISGKVTQYEDSSDGFWTSSERTGTKLVNDVCVPAQIDEESGDVQAVDLKGATGVCFKEGPPNYDETRCNFFGADPNGVPGYNPADNIFESIRCGCITDTYSHLKNYLKIQEGIKKCLEQAKIGEVEGSYCERLMGQAVCDIGTNVLFNTIGQKTSRTGTDGQDPHENILTSALSGARQGDQVLNDRYEGTFYSQAGLGTQNIVNKVCLGAISGDWSVLSENILTSIDQNEIEPTFGPAFPKSRIQGYNPLTGEMSVMYRFTYGAVSGGQRISTEVNFLCDPSQPGGEYCPNSVVSAEEAGDSDLSRRLRVSEDQSTQQTVVITDEDARFKYNVLELVHTYSVKGEQKTKRVEEHITHMGEFIIANCYFSAGTLGAGAGYRCDKLFNNDALLSVYRIDDDKTHLSPDPEKKIYYPGNNVWVNLHYYIRNQQNLHEQTGFDLAWKAVCRGSEGESRAVDFEQVRQGHDNKLIPLFEVPPLGTQQDVAQRPYTLSLSAEQANTLNRKIERDSRLEIRVVNTAGDRGQSIRIADSNFISSSSAAIGQSLTVNQEGENPYATTTINRGANFSALTDLSISLEQQTQNVIIRLVGLDESGNEETVSLTQGREQTVQNPSTFNNLQPGTCELQLRMLPPGDGGQITLDNFDTYNQRDEDISTNVDEGQDRYTDTFTIKNTPRSGDRANYAFEFTKPTREQKFCVEWAGSEGNPQIPKEDLAYLYQTSSQNNDPFNMELSYTITAQRYSGNFGSGEGIALTQGEEVSDEVTLDIPNNIKASTSDTGTTVFPTVDLDLTLGYTLRGNEKGEEGKVVQKETGTINFGARIAESCSATGQSQLGSNTGTGSQGQQSGSGEGNNEGGGESDEEAEGERDSLED